MQQTTVYILIILFVFTSISIAFYQYLYQNNTREKVDYLLFVIRSASIFLVFLLFVNPQIKSTIITNEKPVLSVLVDNSSSISYFDEAKNSRAILNAVKMNKALNNKFDLQLFSFGKDISPLDSLSYSAIQTDISNGITSINELNKTKNSAIILLSDGNQTIGNDYGYIKSEKPVYPIVMGDTTQYTDVRITQVNVNKYSYLNNKFPIETLLFYDGDQKVTTQFSITSNGKTIYKENVTFSPTERSKTITTNLTSKLEGINYYTTSINKIEGEKNTQNNTSSFAVEVINEQTNILILSSFLHPDIGLLKKSIESNKQRKVRSMLIDEYGGQNNDYQLFILYQPTIKFASVFQEIKNKKANYLLISGTQTDWNFLNTLELGFSKDAIKQTEAYTASFNPKFLPFVQNDIGFSDFPPLKDRFGEVTFQKQQQLLLFQNINGISTKQPLLATLANNNEKNAVLFGEGIWKWRSASFLKQNNFRSFDDFTGNLIQFLATNKQRNRLEVTSKSLLNTNETVNISAFYVDENYRFDKRANLWLTVTNLETKVTKKLPLSLQNNSYSIALEGWSSGDYSFIISVDNQSVKKYGRFKISEYNVEEQFANADHNKLNSLAINTNGKLYFPKEINNLISSLVNDNQYYTTQKSTEIEQDLIDWNWLLVLTISLLSLEWFIRKYHGKV